MTELSTATLDAPESRPRGMPRTPSAFYRGALWRAGLAVARRLPGRLVGGAALLFGGLYWAGHPRRRAVVTRNLLPLCDNDPVAARRASRRLYGQFARKLADLWRWEAGRPLDDAFHTLIGWDVLEEVHARGRGALLVTPHLGNWEIGGSLLVQRGLDLLVLTQAEPEADLTELRRQSRSRHGIETLVIGQDAFAGVEVIKRLQAGRMIALLVDRPPAATSAEVRLFGRPFRASTAPAELARASGCAVLGTQIVRVGRGYEARVLPEFQYDRRALGRREERVRFTQEILAAFEPALRRHPDQWYHFVPIWPAPASSGC
jgi:KDO2-lipid IV(A) lauroyltransferase